MFIWTILHNTGEGRDLPSNFGTFVDWNFIAFSHNPYIRRGPDQAAADDVGRLDFEEASLLRDAIDELRPWGAN